MRKIYIIVLLSIEVFAKSCYWDADHERLCYKRYYSISQLQSYNPDLRYYLHNDRVYSFKDIIKVRLKYAGALFMLLEDYDLDFLDVTIGKVYTFKVKDMDQLFSILSNLNNQSYIKDAKPIEKRVYRKGERSNKKSAIKTGTIQGSSSQKGKNGAVMQWKK